MTIEVWNRKRLPLAWLRADDDASFGVVVRERELVDGSRGSGALRNVWTLAPFERVTRRFHVGGERRGVYELGPVDLSVGDLFAREAAIEERDRPGPVHRPAADRRDDRHRAAATSGAALERAKAGLTEDPSRFAGVRPYAPGDPLRRIHPRASARLGAPVTKRFEPSRDREVLIALDVQIEPRAGLGHRVRGRRGRGAVRRRRVDRPDAGDRAGGVRARRGRASPAPRAASPTSRSRRPAARPSGCSTCWPGSRRSRRRRSSGCSALVRRIARPGTTILVVTARDPTPFVGWFRRLEQGGCRVVVVACGATAIAGRRPGAVGRVRRPGGAAQRAVADGERAGGRVVTAARRRAPAPGAAPADHARPGPANRLGRSGPRPRPARAGDRRRGGLDRGRRRAHRGVHAPGAAARASARSARFVVGRRRRRRGSSDRRPATAGRASRCSSWRSAAWSAG